MDGYAQFHKHKLQLRTPSLESVHHMRTGSVVAPKQTKVNPRLSNLYFRHAQLFADDELLLAFLREARQSPSRLFSQLPQRISVFAHDSFSNLNLVRKFGTVGC